MSNKSLDKYIITTPGIAGGRPHIVGHRITVQNIAVWHERLGRNIDEICLEYNLSLADVYAALTYYFSNREEIDRNIEEDEAFLASLEQQSPSRLQVDLRMQSA